MVITFIFKKMFTCVCIYNYHFSERTSGDLTVSRKNFSLPLNRLTACLAECRLGPLSPLTQCPESAQHSTETLGKVKGWKHLEKSVEVQ